MFTVYTIKDKKTKQNSNITLNTPKKIKIFTQIISSSIKTEEKHTSPSNSFSINTNNTSDSGKGITNFLQNEKTITDTSQKNGFLSKKTKFHIDLIDKPKEKNKSNDNNNAMSKKRKKTKIISINPEEDINEGRWDPDEHMRFIEAINKYGNEWKEVQKYVGTRSSNQVRSHAQKFFLKLKNYKDPTLGVDFTTNNIKNLSEIINAIKDYEKEKKCVNILSILSQKLSERNMKFNNNSFFKNKNENDIFIKNNTIIIKNQFVNENINNNVHKGFIVKKEDIIKTDTNINKKNKKIVKFHKRRIHKNLKSKESKLDKKEEIKTNEEYNKNNINNKIRNDENFFEYDNHNNKIYYIGDYAYDDINQLNCEINNNAWSSSYSFIKESKTITLLNKNYFS